MNQRSDLNQEGNQESNRSQVGDANRHNTFSHTIPVIEEKVHLDKEVVEKGSVRITKLVSEQEVPVNIPLLQEDHDIERVPVNQYVDTPPPPLRYEGDTMIIPILQEVLVVEKRLLVVEELRITKHQVHTQETQHISLRKEEIKIERVSPNHPDTSNNPV